MPEANPNPRGQRKARQGVVVGNAMDKSVVVRVERRVKHQLYGKVMRRTKKYMVHDEKNACQVGDTVRIVESRPMSRRKRWRLQEILVRAKI